MMIIRTLFALALLLVEGALFLRLVQGKHSVLSLLEYVAYGLLLGSALVAYVIFGAALVGVPLSLKGLLWVHQGIFIVLIVLILWRCRTIIPPTVPLLPPSSFKEQKLSRWLTVLVGLLAGFAIIKILIGGYDLLLSPVYFNDTYANWNMRSKAFFTNESLMLDLPAEDEMYFGGRVPSYPLAVYLSKVWLAKAAGGWSEGVVNSIHGAWFLALLASFFAGLRREGNTLWALAGTYALTSLPLLLIHGMNPYADVLMAAFLFVVLFSFLRWMRSDVAADQNVWLRIFGVMTAAMLFVKNEAMLIFLPPLILVFAFSCIRFGKLILRFRGDDFSRWAAIVSVVAVPWMFFKVMHGLTFGNATGVSGFSLVPQEGVAFAIEGDLFFTGGYLLLFPLCILLLFLGFHHWRKDPLRLIILYLFIVFAGEFFIYALTPLSIEAIRHTGFGRGMVHLLPLIVFVCILLLQRLLTPKKSSSLI